MTAQDKFLRQEYTARINRVIDYIDLNIDKELSLAELAEVANFSRFHFHRIFAAMRGETLNQFIQRLRVEKAATLLVGNPKKSITEIALDCGYSGSAAFARSFREAFGMSASEWRSRAEFPESNIRKTDGNLRKTNGNSGKECDVSSMYLDAVTNNQTWRIIMKENMKKIDTEVRVEEWPDMEVAYVRHVGPYKGDSELFGRLYGTLMGWAGPRGLLQNPDLKMFNVYHDNPEITEDDNLRLSICMTIPEGTEVDGEVGKMTLAGGKYAIGHFEIDVDQYQDAWNTICGGWLPESGYQPEDGPCMEQCLNNPAEHPEGKHLVDICIPVKPL